MNHASTFSGIGGFDLAAEMAGFENVFHVEINPFGRAVLKYYWPKSISYNDITKTDFTIYRGKLNVLSGGFPCQDASVANQSSKGQQGLQGERTGLYFEFVRAIDESRPCFVVAENVANILKVNGGKDFSRILTELSGMGYNAEWRVCRASEKGAPHHRARLYLVAYSSSIRLQKGQTFIPYVHEKASQKRWEFNGTTVQNFRGGVWSGEPPVLLLDDGVSFGLHGTTFPNWCKETIEASGNAIVPAQAVSIFLAIKDFINGQG